MTIMQLFDLIIVSNFNSDVTERQAVGANSISRLSYHREGRRLLIFMIVNIIGGFNISSVIIKSYLWKKEKSVELLKLQM